jgi:addiction module RelE/StbE family toxin
MACQIIWSPVSRDDLHDLVRTIAADSPERAESFAYRLMQQMDKLQNFPEIGRQVPEQRNPNIREIVVPPYRVIYRVRQQEKVVEIVRVWHSARGEPKLKPK